MVNLESGGDGGDDTRKGARKKPRTVSGVKSSVHLRCSVAVAPLQPHTDSKGILQMVHQTRPRFVVLVHGVEIQMQPLSKRILTEAGSGVGNGRVEKVVYPENFEEVLVPLTPSPRRGDDASDALRVDFAKQIVLDVGETKAQRFE